MPHKIHALDDPVYFHFASNDTSGSGDDGATPVYDVRLCGAAAGAEPVLSDAAILLTHADYSDGSHEVGFAATEVNGFAAGNEYAIFCALAVDGENPTGLVGSFKLVAAGTPIESSDEVADAVWDEELTGATHNIARSAGRRLRQLEPSAFTTWYVDGVGGNDANDGDSPDDPFLTIGAALAVVAAGETIVVGAASYDEAGIDLNVASVTLSVARGAILTGGGVGTCLAISAASCIVTGGLYLPGAAEVGIEIEGTADYTLLLSCRTSGCLVGFDVRASMCALENCRSVDHTATGFDITGDFGRFDDCDAMGDGAVRGFYLRTASADNNQFHSCHTLDNTVAGFAVVVGADSNCFAFCASGGSDGARVDAGANNSWGGYAVLPLLTQADILSDATAFDGADIAHLDADVSSRAATGDEMALLDGAITQAKIAAAAFIAAKFGADFLTANGLASSAVDEIVDQVWDELIADHLAAGSTGEKLNTAGCVGDPWSVALPGSYAAGTAGNIIGNLVTSIWNALTSAMTTVGSIGKKLADATWGIISVGVTPYLLSADQDELEVRWGDEVTINFTIENADGDSYDFTNTTKIYFTVKRGDHLSDTDDTNAVIGDGVPKSMAFDPAVAGAASVTLLAEDTKRCKMDDPYRFDIEIINSVGDSPVTAIVGIFRSTTTVTRTDS